MPRFTSADFTYLIELEAQLRDTGYRLSKEDKLEIGISLFDDALSREDVSSAWSILQLIEPLSLKGRLAPQLALRKVSLLRLSGHVSECLKYIDYCHVHIEMTTDEKIALLWQRQLLSFYVTLDLTGLEVSVFGPDAKFTSLAPRLQTFILGRAITRQKSVAWSLERIMAEASYEERYSFEYLIQAAEFVAIVGETNSSDIGSLFNRELEQTLGRLDLFSRLVSQAAIIKIMSQKKIYMATRPLIKSYEDLSISLSNGVTKDCLGLLKPSAVSDRTTQQLRRSLVGQAVSPRLGFERNLTQVFLQLKDTFSSWQERLLLLGLDDKARSKVRHKFKRDQWKRIHIAIRQLGGQAAHELRVKTFLSAVDFTDFQNFLKSAPPSDFISFKQLAKTHKIDPKDFPIHSEQPFYQSPFEQLYRLDMMTMPNHLLRVPIFSTDNSSSGTASNYERIATIQKDLKMSSALPAEFDVRIAELVEWDNSWAITRPVTGQPLTLIWKQGDQDSLSEYYQRILKTLWGAALAQHFVIASILPQDVVLDSNGQITLMNINDTVKLKEQDGQAFQEAVQQNLYTVGSDREFIDAVSKELSCVHVKKRLTIHRKIYELIDPQDQSLELRDFVAANSGARENKRHAV